MPHISQPTGLWIPLVTPFLENSVDIPSITRLVTCYARKSINGLILAATTGEGQLLSRDELKLLVFTVLETLEEQGVSLGVYVGISASDPVRAIAQIVTLDTLRIDGYLLSGPTYLRPGQTGVQHFVQAIASCTQKNIILYNIPYRTGVNIENETMLELANLDNIVGVKDCCTNREQSCALIRLARQGFSVLTGEDPFFFDALANGASGAIVTGAHVLTDAQLTIIKAMKDGDHAAALATWNRIAHIPRVLFSEPNPAPLKYWLWREGLITSPEARIPFMPVSEDLAATIDQVRLEKTYVLD